MSAQGFGRPLLVKVRDAAGQRAMALYPCEDCGAVVLGQDMGLHRAVCPGKPRVTVDAAATAKLRQVLAPLSAFAKPSGVTGRFPDDPPRHFDDSRYDEPVPYTVAEYRPAVADTVSTSTHPNRASILCTACGGTAAQVRLRQSLDAATITDLAVFLCPRCSGITE